MHLAGNKTSLFKISFHHAQPVKCPLNFINLVLVVTLMQLKKHTQAHLEDLIGA